MNSNTITEIETKVLELPLLERKLLESDFFDSSERIEKIKRITKAIMLPIIGVFTFGLIWEVYSMKEGVSLPGPMKTISESMNLILHPWFDNGSNDKGLGWQILFSLKRVSIGYLGASVAGVILGILIGKFASLYKAVDPIFQVLRTIPPLGWLPISLATFNKAEPSAIFVIFITALWPVIINTSVGVQRIPKDYENIAKVYNINGSRYFYRILLPATAPYIFTGLRIAIGMAWLAIVASEMLAGGVGIGFFIWDSWNSSKLSDLIVAVIYVGIVGLTLDRSIALIGRFFGTKAE